MKKWFRPENEDKFVMEAAQEIQLLKFALSLAGYRAAILYQWIGAMDPQPNPHYDTQELHEKSMDLAVSISDKISNVLSYLYEPE